MADLKAPAVLLVLLMIYFLYFQVEKKQNFAFQISSTTVKYHSNWTSNIENLPSRKQLQNTLRNIHDFSNLDLSFAHSMFPHNFLTQLFPVPFSTSFTHAKINVGSIPLKTQDIEYLISLLPNTLQHLELHFDSIKVTQGFGLSLAYQLNRFTLLKSLTISLIMSLPKNHEELQIFFKLHKPRENFKSLNLILIGNEFKPQYFSQFSQYLKKFNLQNLELNLYANKLGPEGAQYLAQAIGTQPSLNRLSVDLYFNNITQVGTASICKNISQLTTLQSLSLNFDFNFIKNEGGKQIGNLLKNSNMKTLKELQIGVASKNFGYLGFKDVIDGMQNHDQLKRLTLRCGINRVGMNGAQIVVNMLEKMNSLQYLNLGFVENYVGDQGLNLLSSAISTKLPQLKQLFLNIGFNDAKSYGLVNTLKLFSEKSYNYLFLGLSNNEFRDRDVELIYKYLPKLIRNNGEFYFDFADTAISKNVSSQIKKIFTENNAKTGKNAQLAINSIIPEEGASEQSAEAEKQQERIKSNNVAPDQQKLKQQKQKEKQQQQKLKQKQSKEASKKLQKQRKAQQQKQAKQKAEKEIKQKKQRQQKQRQQKQAAIERGIKQAKLNAEKQAAREKQIKQTRQRAERELQEKMLKQKAEKQAAEKKAKQLQRIKEEVELLQKKKIQKAAQQARLKQKAEKQAKEKAQKEERQRKEKIQRQQRQKKAQLEKEQKERKEQAQRQQQRKLNEEKERKLKEQNEKKIQQERQKKERQDQQRKEKQQRQRLQREKAEKQQQSRKQQQQRQRQIQRVRQESIQRERLLEQQKQKATQEQMFIDPVPTPAATQEVFPQPIPHPIYDELDTENKQKQQKKEDIKANEL